MINNLLVEVNGLLMHMLTSLSVDEILLPRYVNWSANFIGLVLKVDMAQSHLKRELCFILLAPGYAVAIQLEQICFVFFVCCHTKAILSEEQ